MNRRFWIAGAPMLLAAAIGMAACSRAIDDNRGGNFTGEAPLDGRTRQIERAAQGLGWQTDVVGPGMIRATLNLRTHVAVTDIGYDTTRFTIRYADSRNLRTESGGIHRNYNAWTRNLERAIIQQPVP